MTFKRALWRATRIKMAIFLVLTAYAVAFLGIGGQSTLPTERKHDPISVCRILPSVDNQPKNCER